MQSKQRVFILPLLIVLLIFFGSVLSGCGATEEAPVINLTLWHYYNGAQLVSFEKMVQSFNETRGRELNIFIEATAQGSISNLTEKVLEIAQGMPGTDDLPDIFFAYGDSAYVVKEMGLTVALDDYFTSAELDLYVDAFINEGRFPPDYSLTIMPVAKANEILFVDAIEWGNFIERSSHDFSSETLATWEGILLAAEAYYEDTDNAFFGIDSLTNYFFTGMYQRGINFVTYEGDSIVFDLNEKVIRELWDFYFDAFMNGWFTAAFRFRSDDAKNGELIAFIGSRAGSRYFPSVVTLADGSHRDADLLALPAPYWKDGVPASISQGAGMVVTKSETNRERAAVEFLKWFTELERNIVFSINSSYLPVNKNAYTTFSMETMMDMLDEEEGYAYLYERRVLETAVRMMSTQESFVPAVFEQSFEIRSLMDALMNFFITARETSAGNSDIANQLREDGFREFYDALLKLCTIE